MPIELEVGYYYKLRIDVWDPDGEPLVAADIVTVFVEPIGERPFPATPDDDTGQFSVRRRFDDPGTYVMKVYPPTLDEPVEAHFEVRRPKLDRCGALTSPSG